MKSLLLLLPFCIVCSTLLAQEPAIIVPEPTTSSGSNERYLDPVRSSLNEEDRIIARQTDLWDTEFSIWQAFDSLEYTYREDGQLEEVLTREFDGALWPITSRFVYFYDDQGNFLTGYSEEWDGLEFYIPEGEDRILSTYDGNGNELSSTNQVYENGVWRNIYRFIYQNPEPEVLSLFQLYENEAWVNSSRRIEADTDPNGQILIENIEIWENNEWVLNERWLFEYDNNGNFSLRITQDLIDNEWINDRRYGYVYSEDNLLLEYRLYNWDESLGVWLNWLKADYFYDEDGAYMGFLSQLWEESISNWRPFSKRDRIEYTYGVKTEWLRQSWDNAVESWFNSTYSTDYFELFVSTKEELLPADQLTLFPNPNNGQFFIQINASPFDLSNLSVLMHNQLGQQVYQHELAIVDGIAALNTAKLPNGIYIVRITDGRYSMHQKVQIQR